MVEWTDKGIMWHFPINNEQGVEEKDVRIPLRNLTYFFIFLFFFFFGPL